MKQPTVIKSVSSTPKIISTPSIKKPTETTNENSNSGSSSKTGNSNQPAIIFKIGENSDTNKKSLHESLRVSQTKESIAKIHEANNLKPFSNRISLQPNALASMQSSFLMQKALKNDKIESKSDDKRLSLVNGNNGNLSFIKKENFSNNGVVVTADGGVKEPEIKPFEELKPSIDKFSPQNMKGSLIIHKKFEKSRHDHDNQEDVGSSREVKKQENENDKRRTLSPQDALSELRRSIKIPAPSNSNKKSKPEKNIRIRSCLKKPTESLGNQKKVLDLINTFKPVIAKPSH